jgi:hypothetical protein
MKTRTKTVFSKTMRKLNITVALVIVVTISCLTGATTYVLASPTSTFSQQINASTLATDIKDASRVTVASPSVSLAAVPFSHDCQTSTTTGAFGTNTQRVYVDNPGAANNGWTLTIAASATSSLWTAGALKFDFNDAGGCAVADSDTDTYIGQMGIDPSVSTLTADCTSCTVGNISKGAYTNFVSGSVDSITLLTAAAGSDDIGRWYLTGADLVQTIPGDQAAGTYNVDLTLTATAS